MTAVLDWTSAWQAKKPALKRSHMSESRRLKFDEIGYWSEIKLDIVKDYASAYWRILAAQRNPRLHHMYIDAFAGAGVHVSKTTGEYIRGSPINALLLHPSFREYHLIDIDRQKVALLRDLVKNRKEVHIHEGDCNRILLEKIFPNVRWEQYRRGLCLLDPYGLQLNWKVIEIAGKMRSIDMFLNFPVADINRNVLWPTSRGCLRSRLEAHGRILGRRFLATNCIYDETGSLRAFRQRRERSSR